MINYSDDMNIAYCDGYKFVRDKKSNYYLSSKKINGRRLRLHIYVWTKSKGKIPKGYHIHHVDKNKLNNDISNLMCVTKKEHESLHKEDKREYDENLLRYMQELAREWHKSKDGRKWHSEHAKNQWKNKKEIKYVCTNCGAEFYTKRSYGKEENRFCSNKCKSAYRRKMGYDNITVKCERCGNEFVKNKYSKAKMCEKCRHKRDRIHW